MEKENFNLKKKCKQKMLCTDMKVSVSECEKSAETKIQFVRATLHIREVQRMSGGWGCGVHLLRCSFHFYW